MIAEAKNIYVIKIGKATRRVVIHWMAGDSTSTCSNSHSALLYSNALLGLLFADRKVGINLLVPGQEYLPFVERENRE